MLDKGKIFRMVTPYDPLSYEHLAESVVRALLATDPEPIPPDKQFPGAGVYAIYYTGSMGIYKPIAHGRCKTPIYVGKAVFSGGRKGQLEAEKSAAKPLYNRLKQHANSIEQAENLEINDFSCRFLVVRETWVRIAEEFLIRRFLPVWNVIVDGFGNHNPGKGRKDMICPKWDTLHPGRPWADKLKKEYDSSQISLDIRKHLQRLL